MPSQKNSTEYAVASQLAALAHGSYEVGITFPDPDEPGETKMMIRSWTAAQLEQSMGFLKARNLRGAHIYIRPEGAHAYSFVDDLTAEAVTRMKAEDFPPALVVESSPGNFQAWVAHGETLDPKTSTAVAKALAARFGGDPSSADWRHFGRLVGFTNRKEKHRRADGKFPFVRLTESSGVRAPGSAALIERVRAELREQAAVEDAKRQAYRHAAASADKPRGLKTIEDFHASSAYAGDLHRADLAYATYALSKGMSADAVAHAIASRDLSHKGNAKRQQEYIDRTIRRAAENAGPGR